MSKLKTTITEMIKHILTEVTQGEEEFAELEAARKNFVQNRGDDEAISKLLSMVEKLVEPLMTEMGLFFEVQELLNNGNIVFTNDRNMEVRIDPRGAMGRYDVQVNPLHDAHDSFDPVKTSLDSMKGVVQYIKDEFREELQRGGTYKQPPMGMVGEPEGQMELPLPRENKMRITKSQLQQVIREALDEEMEDRISGAEMLAMYDAEQGLDVMSAEEAMDELEQILKDIRKTSLDDRSSQQADRAEDLLRVIVRG